MKGQPGQRWYQVSTVKPGRRFPVSWGTWANSPEEAAELIAAHLKDGFAVDKVTQVHR